MNRTNLKNYAPQARRDFIQAMKDRAAYFGLTDTKSEPVVVKGDVAVIGGRSFPIAVAKKRKALEDRIKRHGFEQTMEAMAYTWFNRLVAIRFMELHGYLEHGYRVLSHPEGKPTPEILEHAEHVELPGLKKEAVIDLKLAGNKEAELYRLLLTSQCNALHTAMPFLFEKIEDETELLLPDNLLNSDSLMRKLVGEIEEEDWNEVEIIGWMYQFYISEKKDEVIGKVVASEDIPAATQLFTPNWIVKYLVQNTLGRQWLATYPQSPLRQQMKYYIEPAEQSPEVLEQLKAITPTSLNPEELTLLDPACGSGHILVEAYDLFKAIYQERGYRAKDIPALILQKNLFGMEIDDRAAQLAAFALMMKARADDRRIFDSEAKLNILAFEDSQGLKPSDIYFALTSPLKGEKEDALKSPVPDGYLFEPDDNLFTRAEDEKAVSSRTPTTVNFTQADIASLLELFENAKTFGSLIQVPTKLAAKLPEIEKRVNDVLKFGDLTHASAHVLTPLLQQTHLLARQYDAVVANPPYMGGKYFTGHLKTFVADNYKEGKADLYACFIQRNLVFAKARGLLGMITIPNWMFLSSFEGIRGEVLASHSIETFLHNGRGVFGSDFGSCAFTLRNRGDSQFRAVFRKLFERQGSVSNHEEIKVRFFTTTSYTPVNADFLKLPGSPLAYSTSESIRSLFAELSSLAQVADLRQGMSTGNGEKYLRLWFEVSQTNTSLPEGMQSIEHPKNTKWFPYNKGGAFRKWYGNREYVVNFFGDGEHMQADVEAGVNRGYRMVSRDWFFRPGITWTDVSISFLAARAVGPGFIFENTGSMLFCQNVPQAAVLAFMCSSLSAYLMSLLNPSVHFTVGEIKKLPFKHPSRRIEEVANECVRLTALDWDSSETSWDFTSLPIICESLATLVQSQEEVEAKNHARFVRMKELETENNRLFIEAYGLQGELSPEVPDEHITLNRTDRAEDIKRLLSYTIGCIMGRYSLDKPGLIYARSGNQGFDASQYKTFLADDDGIIPLLNTDWGIRDDATNRFVEFISIAWPKEHLEENLKFVADSLGPTGSEQPRDTIRRYLATGFYKHHLSMYKKRPIYWLFSSGKQRAFQCLVYLHRYHEGTLARMRTEYVIPLQGQIAARIEQLEGDKSKATSTSHRKKLQKEQDDLKKQQTELLTFEEKLKHAADQKISLDLDDGVKVNYAKFGDLLAESKAITGGKDEE
jgi:hypothetical protein